MHRINAKEVFYYLYTKLVGAGFSFSIFMLIYAFFSSLNIFELSETLTSPWIWGSFYGYGIICSLIIDLIIKVWPRLNSLIILLYIFAGFVVFVFLMAQMAYIIIAGSIGLIAALIFYFGVKFVAKKKWISITFAFILPLLLIVIAQSDFTKKREWVEIQGESSFEAEFTYFNGEHKVPIKLKKGDVLSYSVDFYTNDGWGNHLENEKGKHMPMDGKGDMLIFKVEEDGEYSIVIRGTSAAGSFVVNWDISDG